MCILYLGDLVGLCTTNALNWCSWGAREVGVAGDFPLFRRATLALILFSGSVSCANSLTDIPRSLLMLLLVVLVLSDSDASGPTFDEGFTRVLFSEVVCCANALAERLQTDFEGALPDLGGDLTRLDEVKVP